MKKEYLENVDSILNDGNVENIPLKNIDILKSIFHDDEVGDSLYKNFEDNYHLISSDLDDLYSKCGDLIYRMNLLVNDCLIVKYEVNDESSIKEIINDFISNDADFYSAVSYDDFDNEIIDEFEMLYNEVGVSI